MNELHLSLFLHENVPGFLLLVVPTSFAPCSPATHTPAMHKHLRSSNPIDPKKSIFQVESTFDNEAFHKKQEFERNNVS